jgi:hypothetical protein
MRTVIIATMDVMAFLAFGAVLLSSLIMMVLADFGEAVFVLVVGLFGCCLVFGAWYALLGVCKVADKK